MTGETTSKGWATHGPRAVPVPITSLVGRTEEIPATVAAVAEHRLVTLFGPGGAGKTRLAQHVVAERLDVGVDGTWYVELMPIRDPGGVAGAFVAALPSAEVQGADAQSQLLDLVGDGDQLFVVDNCEHLVDTVADVVDALLRSCPNARVLATSRELLKVPGEHAIPVGALATPPLSDASVVDLTAFEATRLFLERATGLELDGSHAQNQAIVRVCEALDGLPLAIELAAARTRLLSVQQIADGLDDRFTLLGTGARTAPDHQQTLDASIGWSFALLEDVERRMLTRLSVFPGPFDLDAAVAVGDQAAATIDVLGSLVDKSLVVAHPDGDAQAYRLLESIRVYGLEVLREQDELTDARDAHLDHAVARSAEIGLALVMAMGGRSIGRARAFMDDARAADAWAHARGTPEVVVDLHWPLLLFHQVAETTTDVIASLETAIGSARLDLDHRARAYAMLVSLPGQSGVHGDVVTARSRSATAIRLARRHGDPFVLFVSLSGASFAEAWSCSDGTAHAREAIEVAETLGLPMLRHVGEAYLAMALLYAGRGPETLDHSLATAERLERDEVEGPFRGIARTVATSSRMLLGPISALDEELERTRRATSARGTSRHVIVNTFILPYSLLMMGRIDDVTAHAERTLSLAPTPGTLARSAALLGCAIVHEAAGDAAAAVSYARSAVEAFEGRWNGMWLWMSQSMLALALEHTGEIDEAAALVAELRRQVPDDGFFIVHATLGIAECLVAQHTRPDDCLGLWIDHAHREVTASMWTWNVRTLGYLAAALVDADRPADAMTVLGALEVQARRLEVHYTAEWHAPRVDAQQRARTALGVETADEHRAVGADMGVEDVLAWLRRRRGPQRRATAGWDAITPTEQAVVDKVVQGMTNAEVAEALFVTVNTVKTHLSNVYRKLDVRSRAALTARALEREGHQPRRP